MPIVSNLLAIFAQPLLYNLRSLGCKVVELQLFEISGPQNRKSPSIQCVQYSKLIVCAFLCTIRTRQTNGAVPCAVECIMNRCLTDRKSIHCVQHHMHIWFVLDFAIGVLIRFNLIVYPILCYRCHTDCIRFNSLSEILFVVGEATKRCARVYRQLMVALSAIPVWRCGMSCTL